MAPSQVDSNAVNLINQLRRMANTQQGGKSSDALIDFAQILLNGPNNHENSAGAGQHQSNAGISDLLEKGIDLLEDVKEMLNTSGLETEGTDKATQTEGKVDAASQTETDEASSIPELIGKLVEGLQQLVDSLKSASGEAAEATESASPAEGASAEATDQTAAAETETADETEDDPQQILKETLEKITNLLQELVSALKEAGIIEGGPEEAASGAEDAAKTGSDTKAEGTEAAEAANQKETEEAETPSMEELLTKLAETLEELIAAFKEAGLIEDDAGKAEETASAEETTSPSAANAAEESSETDQEKTIEELLTQLGDMLEQLKAALSQPEEGGQAGQPINIDTGSGDDTVIIGPSGTTEEAEAAQASGNGMQYGQTQ